MNKKCYKWIAICLFVVAGLWLGLKMASYEHICLYYPDSNGEWLECEQRRVLKVDKTLKADMIMEELIKGPNKEGFFNPIPEGTVLLPLYTEKPKIKIENGLATVNLSYDFIKNHPGGSTGEIMTLGAIVNSLTELKEISEVQLLINGEKYDSLAGHFSIREPMSRMEELIKPKK
ncbi:GerMN domain-containing protein [Clostridium sp. 'deep sea']|uniref:GerMN domain-containing protein n=1 Tax=Clostridium sp. 'deep sea' TaxID=2779445 RepID=UPI00189667CC|nr:GerMN domain-containing protein [Clostridium sp. 'deep sea']QOR34271.1 GerMN domain-containing protein [Clostridium sp. 'deep sea']